MSVAREELKNSQKIVIKVGTSILTSRTGKISKTAIARLGKSVLSVRALNKKVALVSSGAIAFGMETYAMEKRPKLLAQLQACAAVGQGKLMHAYEHFFLKHRIVTAQLLLTRDGLEIRERFLAARNTFQQLFRMDALPIINENDTVTTEEIAFSDNDILSVHVAHLIQADLLILLSDVDGFYLKDGSRIRQVTSVEEIDTELTAHLVDTRKERNVGGMKAKLVAARVAMRLGVPLMIVNGHIENIIQKVLEGEDTGTLFRAAPQLKNSRKKWIAFGAARQGTIVVDPGAYQALRTDHKSLLARGLKKIKGDFDRGDVVELATLEGHIFGRGVVRFSSVELARILGRKSVEIESILGYPCAGGEVIHRNDLFLWG